MYSKIRVGIEIEQFYVSDSYDTLQFGEKIKNVCKKRGIPLWSAYDDASGPVEYSTKVYSSLKELYEAAKNIQDVADEISGNYFPLGAGQLFDKLTASLHVHVNAPSCKQFYKGITYYIPELVALTANSPFPIGNDWIKDYRLVNGIHGNKIEEFSPGKWGYQTHCYRHSLGSVEIRVLDAQPTVEDASAITGLIWALAFKIMDKGVNTYDMDDLKKNFSNAQSSGFDTTFIKEGHIIPAYKCIEEMFMDAKEYFKDLDFPPEIESLLQERIETRRCPAERIIDIYKETSPPPPPIEGADLKKLKLYYSYLLAAQENKKLPS
jgi:gamma-glutamyl:cysteine ligase YbdK (ATP-grasp superfamily)